MTVKVTLTNVWISILLNVVLFLSRILFYKLYFFNGRELGGKYLFVFVRDCVTNLN